MFYLPAICSLRVRFSLKLLVLALLLIAPLVCAVPHPVPPSRSSPKPDGNSSTPDAPNAVTFAVPCPGCFHGAADAALPFELVHTYSDVECDSVVLHLNGQPLVLGFQENIAQGDFQITTAAKTVDLRIEGYCDQNASQPSAASRQVLFFDIDPQDGSDNLPFFTVVLDRSAHTPPLVVPHPHSETACLSTNSQLESFAAEHEATAGASDYAPQTTDSQDESAKDSPTKNLRERFNDEQRLIRRLTMDCRKKLFDDLKDCDHDLKCSGKALCHHIHDAVVSLLANLKSSLQQSPMVSNAQQWQAIAADEKAADYGTTNPVDSPTPPKPTSLHSSTGGDKKNIILLALEILAGALGLAGLLACIRRHCRSIRRRVDHLADREERKRAREYRSLARKEAMRKRWVAFRRVFRLPCRKGHCEEKRALILEASAPAVQENGSLGDLEQAWSTVLAGSPDHYIVGIEQAGRDYLASLAERSISARAGKNGDTRSRSSSLPSYESEKLPQYSSQPPSDVFIVDGARVYTPSLTGRSTNTAITPDSSVPSLSPRCSGETLRTLMSRD